MKLDTLAAELGGTLYSFGEPNDLTMVRAALIAQGLEPEEVEDFDAGIVSGAMILLCEIDDGEVVGARALGSGTRAAFAVYSLIQDRESVAQQESRIAQDVREARNAGLSLRRIAQLLGINHERVRQISLAHHRPAARASVDRRCVIAPGS